jgi:hypothetical protein
MTIVALAEYAIMFPPYREDSMRALDLTGQRFGKLVAVEPAGSSRRGQRLWRCRCDCGGESVVEAQSLRSANTKSCGCGLIAKPLDLAGMAFGRLTAVRVHGASPYGRNWLCHCACGNECIVPAARLTNGNTKSCGCLNNRPNAHNRKHGHAAALREGRRQETPTYRAWSGMKARCDQPNADQYPRYGGRGIRYCEAWGDFGAFLRDMGERPKGTTLDRIDRDGNYEPGNCRWATPTQQTRNRSNTIRATGFGETLTLGEWAERFGKPWGFVYKRVMRGATIEEIAALC